MKVSTAKRIVLALAAAAMAASLGLDNPAAWSAVAASATPSHVCALSATGPLGLPCGGANRINPSEETTIARDEAPHGDPILDPYNDMEDDQSKSANKDPGNCTIGLGHLIHPGKCTADDYTDWAGATRASLIDQFHQDIAQREVELNKTLIRELDLTRLNPCQYDGLFDLYFNGGPSWFAPKTRLYSALRGRDMSAVARIIENDVPDKIKNEKVKKELAKRRQQDAAEFRKAHCPCQVPPVVGSFSGTLDEQGWGTVSWTGEVRFSRAQPDSTGLAIHDWYTSASVSWTLAGGSLPSGCTWKKTSGTLSGSQLSPLSNAVLFKRYYQLILSSNKEAEATYTCSNGGPFPVSVGNVWLLNDRSRYDHLNLRGSFSDSRFADKWDLKFEIKPGVTP